MQAGFVDEAAGAAHMQDAGDVIDVVLEYRQPGVFRGLNVLQQYLVRVVEVQAEHFPARHHDVVDRDLFEFEDIQQHALVGVGNHVAGIVNDGAQFLGGQARLTDAPRVKSQQPQQAVGDDVDQPHHRVQQFQQRREDGAGREGDAFRVQGGDGLGGDLCEHQQHQGQQQRADGDAGITQQANGDDGDDGGRQHVDQVIANQDQADQAVGTLEQPAGPPRAAVVLFLEML